MEFQAGLLGRSFRSIRSGHPTGGKLDRQPVYGGRDPRLCPSLAFLQNTLFGPLHWLLPRAPVFVPWLKSTTSTCICYPRPKMERMPLPQSEGDLTMWRASGHGAWFRSATTVFPLRRAPRAAFASIEHTP